MSTAVDNTQHMYFAADHTGADVATDPSVHDPNAANAAQPQSANSYVNMYSYHQSQAIPMQQYAASFYSQGHQFQSMPYGTAGQPTPAASPMDPATGQPTAVAYAHSVAPHTPSASPAASPAPSRRSRGIQESGPYFRETEQHKRVYSMDRTRSYKLRIFPKIDRGFFLADNDWTCYRRNYFQVSCSFTALDAANQRLELPCFVETDVGWWTVTQFLIGVNAKTSTNTREIELVQHTAKRDKGPQMIPSPRPCDPQQVPVLNFRQDPESRAVVTFERLQFKSATANNGKRRAAQQYHVLLIELYARCDNGQLLKIAICESAPLVVRGRAPGHYAQMSTKGGDGGYSGDFPSPEPPLATTPEGAGFQMMGQTGSLPPMMPSNGSNQSMYPGHYPDMQYYQQYQYGHSQAQQYQYPSHFDPNAWYGRTDAQGQPIEGDPSQQPGGDPTHDPTHPQHRDHGVTFHNADGSIVDTAVLQAHIPTDPVAAAAAAAAAQASNMGAQGVVGVDDLSGRVVNHLKEDDGDDDEGDEDDDQADEEQSGRRSTRRKA